MNLTARILIAALTVCYPLAIYYGLQHWGTRTLAPILLVIGGAHLVNALNGKPNSWLWVVTCAAIGAWTWYSDSTIGLKLYPVCISVALLVLFAWGLLRPPTIIQRFAELKRGQLTADDIRYTRRVTIAWCIFFAANGVIAASLSVAGTTASWALYNGLISYLLMAALFCGERVTRHFHLQKPL